MGQLCRALLVKHLKGWSYRHTCAELQTNNLVRTLDLFQQAISLLPPTPSIHSLHKWMGLLAKALADEFVCQRDPAGVVVSVRHATEKERGSFVLGSTVDPEATFRKHGDQADLGYNVHVAATKNFIREIFVTTGAVPDGAGVAGLIAHQLEQLGTVPPKLIYDRAAGSPKIFHAVDQASGGQTQLVARLINHSQNSQRFGPLDFTLEADGSLTCPGDQSSTKAYRSNGADGWTYRFSAAQCQGCPLWEKCRGPLAAPEPSPQDVPAPVEGALPKKKGRTGPKPKGYRQVFISDYRSQQRLAILYTRTAQFQADMKLRPGIEGTIAALVRYNDARQAHAIGLLKADCQERMAAVAFNLKRWRRLTLAQEKAQRVSASTGPPDAAPD